MGVSPSFYFSGLSKPILGREPLFRYISGNNPKKLAKRIRKTRPSMFP